MDGVRVGNRLPGAVYKYRAHEAERLHDQEVQHPYAEVHHPYVYQDLAPAGTDSRISALCYQRFAGNLYPMHREAELP